jgi:hypothetical protein
VKQQPTCCKHKAQHHPHDRTEADSEHFQHGV